jgi:putative FmdB family regulatory protein
MPIYEFYCPDCNTVFSFFSATVAPDAAPSCPRCGRAALGRRPSRFAALRGGLKASDDDGGDSILPGVDDARMESAMESMAAEMETMGEDAEQDPRLMARFFRRFGETAGLELGPKMEEMVRRLEAGEDPESLEDELGGGGEGGEDGEGPGGPGGDEDFEDFFRLKKKVLAARRKPKVDETLYFL